MASGGFVVLVDHLPEIIEQLHHACSDIVGEVAKEIATTYSETAAKDTGFMRSSAYTRTHDASTYGANTGEGPMLPEVEAPASDLEAIAAVGAEYAAYLEYGTVHMGAQPAFHPAVDAAEQSFARKFDELESRIHVK